MNIKIRLFKVTFYITPHRKVISCEGMLAVVDLIKIKKLSEDRNIADFFSRSVIE
jgi:hypothetical protein